MPRNALIIASVVLLAALLCASLAVGAALPGDARLAVHWNLAGQPDSYASKWVALLIPPLIAAAVAAMFAWLPRLEPFADGLSRSTPLYHVTWAATLGVLAVCHGVVLMSALGEAPPVDRLVPAALGVMLMLIGNSLPKSRRMTMVGIRTPWTLASEDVWIATHRIGGRLMLVGGAALVAVALLQPAPLVAGAVLVATLLSVVVVPVVYSWLAWRREQAS